MIPQKLIDFGTRFILVERKSKDPVEKSWQSVNNYTADDSTLLNHLSHRGNYGVLPLNGLCILDIDNREVFMSTGIQLPSSFTVKRGESRRGHYYFTCADCPPEHRTKHPMSFGDVRLGGNFFVVGAGSTHPTGDIYEVNTDNPIIDIKWDVVKPIIETHGKLNSIRIGAPLNATLSGGQRIGDKLNLQCWDIAPPTGTLTHSGDEIKGSHPVHGSTTGGNFQINTSKNTWHCFRCNSGGDALILYAVSKGIIDCSEAGEGCLDECMGEVLDALRDDGYDVDDDYTDATETLTDATETLTDAPVQCSTETDVVGLTQEQLDENIKADMIVANAYFNGNDLPDFPTITHPVFNEWTRISEKLSYSRKPYHFGALLTALSVGVGRRACVRIGMDTAYCNIFTMICGVTSISGKSTSCKNVNKKIMPSIVNDDNTNQYNQADNTGMFDDDISDAALVQLLADVNNQYWYYDDCKSFFDTTEGWNKAILPRLCRIYDCEKVSRRLSRRNNSDAQHTVICEQPYMSLLFNMTTSQLKAIIDGNLYNSGFAPRCMWFIENGGELKENTDADEDDVNDIADIAAKIKTVAVALKNRMKNENIVFKVNKTIEQWKIRKTNEYGSNEKYQTALSRGFIHVYKMAMIMTIYDKDYYEQLFGEGVTYPIPSMDISEKWVREAILIEDTYLFPRMVKVIEMAEKVTRTNNLDTVIDALKELGGVATRNELMRQTRFTKKEFEPTIQALMETGEVKKAKIHDAHKRGVVAEKYCLNHNSAVGVS